MNKLIKLGDTVLVDLIGSSGTSLPVYKVSGYQKAKPDDWLPEDLYVEVAPDEKVTAIFTGSADRSMVNEKEYPGLPNNVLMEDGVNEITVVNGEKEYYVAIYLVRTYDAAQSSSGGIIWDDDLGYYFEEMSFFGGVWSSLFGGEPYQDDGQEIVVEAENHSGWGTATVEPHHCCGGGCHAPSETVPLETPPALEVKWETPPEVVPIWTPNYSPPSPDVPSFLSLMIVPLGYFGPALSPYI